MEDRVHECHRKVSEITLVLSSPQHNERAGLHGLSSGIIDHTNEFVVLRAGVENNTFGFETEYITIPFRLMPWADV